MDDWIGTFVVLFVVIDPIGLVPIFTALTTQVDAEQSRRMAIKGTGLAAFILFAVLIGGGPLLAWLGIGLAAFRIAGGSLLFLLAIDMVFARQSPVRGVTRQEQQALEEREDIAVFPLAFPLIAGPGAITTVLLANSGDQSDIGDAVALAAALALVLLSTLAALLFAARIGRLLGVTGSNVITRILGLVLAALAVQFVLDGLRTGLSPTQAPG